MRQPVFRAVDFPLAVLVYAQSIFLGRPHAGSVHRDLKHMFGLQAVFRSEFFPTVPRHLGSARPCPGRAKHQDRNPCLHSVFKYSIRSFNSSLDRSLVTPCRSCGLKTVHISSNVRAEPSCRYGALAAMLFNCGTSISGDRSVGFPVPTSTMLRLV